MRTLLDGQTQSVSVNTTGNTVNNVILPVPTTGIEPDALVTGLNVTGAGGLELQNNAVSAPSATALTFTYEAENIFFATSSRPGMYTARALTNGFRQVPTTITANMTLNGVLTFSNVPVEGHTRTTQTFDVATDTSQLRIETVSYTHLTLPTKRIV